LECLIIWDGGSNSYGFGHDKDQNSRTMTIKKSENI
jgi:hypothetical protein